MKPLDLPRAALVLFSAFVAPLPIRAQTNFAPVSTYGSGGSDVYSVAVADVNGDGNPDIVVVNACQTCSSNGTVGVLLGNGDGTFQAVVNYNAGGYSPAAVAIADVNADGKPHIVVANLCAVYGGCPAGGSVGVLLGNGDGTFQAPVTYASGSVDASSVAVADVNGDGKQDLLVSHQCLSGGDCHGTVAVLLGNGDGTFQSAVVYGSNGYDAMSVVVGDVNGDGNPDHVVANLFCLTNCNATVAVLLGNGDGTFQTAMTYDSGGYEALSVALADVNGDGTPDIVVVNACVNGNSCNNGSISVLLGRWDLSVGSEL
jgi:hypothetical protein